MSWVRLDDRFPRHPKVLKAGPEAAWFFVCALSYCAEFLTDGYIPAEAVRTMTAFHNNEELVKRLLEAKRPGGTHGLLECDGDGYRIHDYAEWQPSGAKTRSEQDEVRRRKSEAGRKGALARWGNRAGSGASDGKTDAAAMAVPMPPDADRNGTPMAPYPSITEEEPPKPPEGGGGGSIGENHHTNGTSHAVRMAGAQAPASGEASRPQRPRAKPAKSGTPEGDAERDILAALRDSDSLGSVATLEFAAVLRGLVDVGGAQPGGRSLADAIRAIEDADDVETRDRAVGQPRPVRTLAGLVRAKVRDVAPGAAQGPRGARQAANDAGPTDTPEAKEARRRALDKIANGRRSADGSPTAGAA